MTGHLTLASSAAAHGSFGTRRPSVSGWSPHAIAKRWAGLGSSSVTAPGSSRSHASRMRGSSSDNDANATARSKNMTALGLLGDRFFINATRWTGHGELGSQASP